MALDRIKVPNIILTGGTASGKTTVGFQLSRLMGFGFLDLDACIEAKAGKPIADIFKDGGEPLFRDIEGDTIEALASLKNHVVVIGAGAVESVTSRAKLKQLGILIWLATPVDNIVARLIMKPDELRARPLLAEAVTIEDRATRGDFLRSKLSELMSLRSSGYEEADVVLADGYATPETGAYLLKSMLSEQYGM